jgi:hypothetical protein
MLGKAFISKFIPSVLLLATLAVPAHADDPLPSWNDTATKTAIVEFMTAVTSNGGPKFVPPGDRIATFDNDGTLWNEKPLYVHFFAIFDHMKQQMANDPGLKDRQPYKAIATKDKTYFLDLYENMAIETLVSDLMAVPFTTPTASARTSTTSTLRRSCRWPRRRAGR